MKTASLLTKVTRNFVLTAAVALCGWCASPLRAETVYVTSYVGAERTPCPPLCVITNISTFGSTEISPADGTPSRTRTYYGNRAGCKWTIQPTLNTPGGVYSIHTAHNSSTSSFTSCSTNVLVTLTTTDGTLSASCTNTTAFQRSKGGPVWNLIGYITNNPGVTQPVITFTHTGGTVDATFNRLYIDAFKFVEDSCCLPMPTLTVGGPLVVGQTNVSVFPVDATATEITIYEDGFLIGQKTNGITAGTNVVLVSALNLGSEIFALQSKSGAASVPPYSPNVVGGGANPQVKAFLSCLKTPSATGPIGAQGLTSIVYYVVKATGLTAGAQSAPQGGETLLPSPCWQTLSFIPGTDPSVRPDDGMVQTDSNPFCSLDALVFAIDTSVGADTGPYDIYIDQIKNGDVVIENFEGGIHGEPQMFSRPNQAPYPNAAATYLPGAPNSALVSTNFAFDGTKSLRIQWQWANASSTRWARIRANAGGLTFPQLDTTKPITIKYLLLGPGTNLNAFPAIQLQPVDRVTAPGATVGFSVTALGAEPLSFQWSKDGVPLTDGPNLFGAASSSLTLSNVLPADAGLYAVTVSNAFGMLISSNASLSIDVTPPVLTCLDIIAYLPPGQCDLNVHYPMNVTASDDYDPAPVVRFNPPSGTLFPVGRSLVQCTAQDAYGNVATNQFTVIVNSSSPESLPVILDATNQVLACDSTDGLAVFYTVTATNVCQPAVPVTCTPPSGSIFPIGVSTVTCVAVDAFNIGVTNTFTVTVAIPPAITEQPVSPLSQLQGTNLAVSVTATGTDLSYQWRVNGTDIAGATGSSYAFSAQPVDGSTNLSYSVRVSNLVGSVVSSNAILNIVVDTKEPILVLTSPVPNARTENLIISGRINDTKPVGGLRYWFANFNNGVTTVSSPEGAALEGSSPMHKTFRVNATPLPGTNLLVLEATDLAGNATQITRKFFYIVRAPFTLVKAGDGNGSLAGFSSAGGNVVPALGTRLLNIGEGYSIRANADRNSSFAGWSGSLGTVTNPVLNFIMAPDLTVVANFVTNDFAKPAGLYNGLFFETSGVRMETAGFLKDVRVTSKGAFSGRVFLNGSSQSFSGRFSPEGLMRTIFTNKGRVLRLAAQLGHNDGCYQLIGAVSEGSEPSKERLVDWVAPLQADLAGRNQTTGSFLLTLPSPSAQLGETRCWIRVTAGSANLLGRLGDGTFVSYNAPLSADGLMPIYIDLYNHGGLLEGWALLRPEQSPSAQLTWIKKPSRGSFPAGFTTVLSTANRP